MVDLNFEMERLYLITWVDPKRNHNVSFQREAEEDLDTPKKESSEKDRADRGLMVRSLKIRMMQQQVKAH